MRFFFLALLFLGVSACKGEVYTNTCRSDSECSVPGTRCDLNKQECVCATDDACAEGQFCNRAGVCQAKGGCSSNFDCIADNTFCDIDSGRCLEGPALALGASCGLASHCPHGSICTDSLCVAGCFEDGDCVLGDVCVNGQCSRGEGLCSSNEFCEYKELCADGECKKDRRGPYCRGCTFRTVQNPEPCDAPTNFCLVNSLEAGGFPTICGVDCSLGQACPNGYDCHGVVILTEQTCTFSAQCKCAAGAIRFASATCSIATPCEPKLPNGQPDPNATACLVNGHPQCNSGGMGDATCIVRTGTTAGNCTCASNADCESGAACVDGVCCTGTVRQDRECFIGENRVSGFCSCASDDDCPQDVCDPSRGACAITGLPCTPGNNDCGAISCVEGGCLIGQNCAPITGLSCTQVGGSN